MSLTTTDTMVSLLATVTDSESIVFVILFSFYRLLDFLSFYQYVAAGDVKMTASRISYRFLIIPHGRQRSPTPKCTGSSATAWPFSSLPACLQTPPGRHGC